MQKSAPQEFDALAESLRPLSRRAFLRGSLAAGAFAVTACTGGNGPVTGRKVLDDTQQRVLDRAIAVMLPAEKMGLTPVAQIPIAANIDAMFARMPAWLQSDLRLAFRIFEWGAVVVGWNFSRFSNLGDEAARDYCVRWQSGNTVQRGIFGVLKQLIFMSYWRDPATWGPIGYEGPVSERYGHVRLGNTPFPG